MIAIIKKVYGEHVSPLSTAELQTCDYYHRKFDVLRINKHIISGLSTDPYFSNINTSDGMSKINAVIVEVLSSDLSSNNAQQVMKEVKQRYFGEPMLASNLTCRKQHSLDFSNSCLPEVPANNMDFEKPLTQPPTLSLEVEIIGTMKYRWHRHQRDRLVLKM